MKKGTNFNPMHAPVQSPSAGRHVLTKLKATMGAGKQMGPAIAPGYLVSAKGDTRPSGGPFAKANTAKRSN